MPNNYFQSFFVPAGIYEKMQLTELIAAVDLTHQFKDSRKIKQLVMYNFIRINNEYHVSTVIN